MGNGLSSNRVSSIIKEKDGFVWVGSDDGLNRYDGNQLKVYSKKNSGISSNNITDVLLDKQGQIWIATLGGGLNVYDQRLDEFTVYKHDEDRLNSIGSNHLRTLFQDSKGQLWIGTENGVSVFNPNSLSFTNYTYNPNDNHSISHNSVTSIFEDENHTIWIGTFGGGLNKFNPESSNFQRISSNNTNATRLIHTVSDLDDHTLLVGTSGGGLLKFDIASLQYRPFFNENLKVKEPPEIVRSLLKDSNHDIWVGTDGNGVIKVEFSANKTKPNIVNYSYNTQFESSLSGNAIYEIIEDDASNIWIGTAWNGINILNPNNNFEFLFSDMEGQNLAPVLSVFKTDKQLFLGLDGDGLTVYNQQTGQVEQYTDRLNTAIGGDYIQNIYQSSEGMIWMGTFANGLIKYDAKTHKFKQYKHDPARSHSISFNDVRSIVEDEKSNLWIASWGGGLNYFNPKTEVFQSFRENKSEANAISSDNIVSVVKQGNQLWLGTFGGGLSLFDIKSKTTTAFRFSDADSKSISSDNIFSLLLDSKNRLWIGTAGGGVNLFDTENHTVNRFEDDEEMRYQTITGIVEDDHGAIWLSTKLGVYKYDDTTKHFSNYPNLAGEYNINAVFKDDMGLIYFGTKNGVVRFNPNMLLHQNTTPNVKIINFKLFNKELLIGENEIISQNISFAQNITLKHNLNVITFDFAAIKLPFSTKCEYAIQMENFDKNWRYIGKDRTVTYTNLAPGKYTFKVKSKTIGSDWGNTYSSLNIKVLKPFWLQWWAFAIYFALVVLIFYLFRKYIIAWEQMKTTLELERVTHEKDIELYNLKHQFFTNISHEIRTPVTLIIGAVNKLLKSNTHDGEVDFNSVKTVKKNGNLLLNLVNELLDYRKLEQNEIKLNVTKQNIVSFCEEIYLSFKELAHQKGVQVGFHATSDAIDLWFDKNQMDKVLYNLLSNAIKFTEENGLVELSILEREEQVVIEIRDEGIGIPSGQLSKIFNRFYQTKDSESLAKPGFGLGLTIAKEIVKIHKGDIYALSQKGEGSVFKIELLKGNNHFTKAEIGRHEDVSERIENYVEKSPTEVSTIKLFDQDTQNKEGIQTLLVVEDNKDIRQYIVELLQNEFNIMEASEGEEALRKVNSTPPDLIISDVMMPVMDGVSLTRKLKTNARTSHIPILLLTARASLAHQIEGFHIGADDYITKPFNEEILRSRIKNVLANRKLLHEKFWKKDLVPISEMELNHSDEKFMSKLINIIEKHISSPDLSAQFVSQELGMSHSVVYKKIKGLTNMTYVEFVRDFKLKTAKKLISEQHFSVLDASIHVGYADRKYFSKLFKQHFGHAPSYYIKKD
ncbi:hybrid sensor histidine kinase/response regulator transcription factor [Pseudotamlana carrageenivorans]|nr:two-component regulator propeller domain-containing protein [Tamlana carrageenivorans]